MNIPMNNIVFSITYSIYYFKGLGGSGCSWTETTYRNNGQSTTITRSRPGGCNGPPGMNGRS